MSTAANTNTMTWNLVRMKLASSGYVLWQLMFLQGLGFLFSLNPNAGGGGGMQFMSYSFSSYSGTIVFFFTVIWMMIVTGGLTLKRVQTGVFSFPATRDTEAWSNGIIMLIYSFIGALTAILIQFPLILIHRFVMATDGIVIVEEATLAAYLSGFIGTWLYLLLTGSLAYLIWTLFQQHVFIRIGTVAALAILLFTPVNSVTGSVFLWIAEENVLTVFAVKALLVSVVFYVSGFLLMRRMEVIR